MRPVTDSRPTQRARLLGLLVSAHGAEVSLREILGLHISQFGARIKELRALGFDIRNRMEIVNGRKQSWYRLKPGGVGTSGPPTEPSRQAQAREWLRVARGESDSLFPDPPAQERQHRDDG